MNEQPGRYEDTMVGSQSDANSTTNGSRLGAENIRGRTEAAGANLGAKVGDIADKGLSAMRENAERAKTLYQNYSEATSEYVVRQPMKAMAISAAIGAVIAALLMAGRRSNY
jgi:ElaB/YqjD/DUF883 family membrane-anchored ribosome-binding protein